MGDDDSTLKKVGVAVDNAVGYLTDGHKPSDAYNSTKTLFGQDTTTSMGKAYAFENTPRGLPLDEHLDKTKLLRAAQNPIVKAAYKGIRPKSPLDGIIAKREEPNYAKAKQDEMASAVQLLDATGVKILATIALEDSVQTHCTTPANDGMATVVEYTKKACAEIYLHCNENPLYACVNSIIGTDPNARKALENVFRLAEHDLDTAHELEIEQYLTTPGNARLLSNFFQAQYHRTGEVLGDDCEALQPGLNARYVAVWNEQKKEPINPAALQAAETDLHTFINTNKIDADKISAINQRFEDFYETAKKELACRLYADSVDAVVSPAVIPPPSPDHPIRVFAKETIFKTTHTAEKEIFKKACQDERGRFETESKVQLEGLRIFAMQDADVRAAALQSAENRRKEQEDKLNEAASLAAAASQANGGAIVTQGPQPGQMNVEVDETPPTFEDLEKASASTGKPLRLQNAAYIPGTNIRTYDKAGVQVTVNNGTFSTEFKDIELKDVMTSKTVHDAAMHMVEMIQFKDADIPPEQRTINFDCTDIEYMLVHFRAAKTLGYGTDQINSSIKGVPLDDYLKNLQKTSPDRVANILKEMEAIDKETDKFVLKNQGYQEGEAAKAITRIPGFQEKLTGKENAAEFEVKLEAYKTEKEETIASLTNFINTPNEETYQQLMNRDLLHQPARRLGESPTLHFLGNRVAPNVPAALYNIVATPLKSAGGAVTGAVSGVAAIASAVAEGSVVGVAKSTVGAVTDTVSGALTPLMQGAGRLTESESKHNRYDDKMPTDSVQIDQMKKAAIKTIASLTNEFTAAETKLTQLQEKETAVAARSFTT